jgi:hypothetical protein
MTERPAFAVSFLVRIVDRRPKKGWNSGTITVTCRRQ